MESDPSASASSAPARRFPHGLVIRLVFLGLAALGLYIVWPTLWRVMASWPRLQSIEPIWFVLMGIAVSASYVCVWWLYRIVLHIYGWYLVALCQLASSAFGRIVPGTAASATALQFGMLVRAGVRGGRVASGITAVHIITGATSLALPLFALPVLVSTAEIESTLRRVGLYGLGICAVVVGFGLLLLFADRPLHQFGRTLDWVKGGVLRRPSRHPDIADRLIAERDIARAVLAKSWRGAIIAALGQRGFDFLALLMAIQATGAHVNPLVVLLAYAVAQILMVVPLTPGGLGFVEVGLVGFLGFAGMASGSAVLAVLAYRLVAYWIPLPVGAVAYGLYVHRYGWADSQAPDPAKRPLRPGAEV